MPLAAELLSVYTDQGPSHCALKPTAAPKGHTAHRLLPGSGRAQQEYCVASSGEHRSPRWSVVAAGLPTAAPSFPYAARLRASPSLLSILTSPVLNRLSPGLSWPLQPPDPLPPSLRATSPHLLLTHSIPCCCLLRGPRLRWHKCFLT